MDWFSGLFLIALIGALISGKAYFRGVSSRQAHPRRYWSTVACYAILASYKILVFPVGGVLSLLTDAATRVAYDIEKGADALHRSGGAGHTILHKPKATPDGCSENYTLQLSRSSSLLVWCKNGAGQTTSSHTTTYHLRFVDVPQTYIVEKKAGEAVFIELAAHGAKPVVVAVR